MDNKPIMKRVIISAAGTGGHIIPGLVIADLLAKQKTEVLWLGGSRDLEKNLVTQAGVNFKSIPMNGVRGKSMRTLFALPWRMFRAMCKINKVMRLYKPQAVITFGGYVTGPVAVVAFLRRIPILLHEQNAIAGLTNRYLSSIATQIFTAFPGAFDKTKPVKSNKKLHLVGNPLPVSLVEWVREKKSRRNMESHKSLHVLVLGGSQGADFLNFNLPKAFVEASKTIPISVRHQTGTASLEAVSDVYMDLDAKDLRYEVIPFISDITAAYAWADCILCRSGAMTVSEVAAAGLPAVFIPFPQAVDDHQAANARYLEKTGAAFLMRQENFSSVQICRWLIAWYQDPGQRRIMGRASRDAARIDAAPLMLAALNDLTLV